MLSRIGLTGAVMRLAVPGQLRGSLNKAVQQSLNKISLYC